jgi:hypothetical protein
VPAADAFVPLAVWLRGPVADADPDPCPKVEANREPDRPAPPTSPAPVEPPEMAELLRDVRLFRARLADALDAATAVVVRELAYAVLGRELAVAPADVATLAARILAERPAAEPVAVHHAPADAFAAPVPAVADPSLAPGDLVLVFRDGTVDARLGVRLAVALEAWS